MADAIGSQQLKSCSSFRYALAALKANLDHEHSADRANETAAMSLNAHPDANERRLANMAVITAARQSRPPMILRLAQASEELARLPRAPENLRASAAKLAVDLRKSLPGDIGTLTILLQKYETDVEALALTAETGPIPKCVERAETAAARLDAAIEQPFPDLDHAATDDEIARVARAVLAWSGIVVQAYGRPTMAKKYPNSLTTILLQKTNDPADCAQTYLGEMPGEFLKVLADFRPDAFGYGSKPMLASWPHSAPVPPTAERWQLLKEDVRRRHAAAVAQCRRLVAWVREQCSKHYGQHDGGITAETKSRAPLECGIERMGNVKAVVREGDTVVTVKGSRQVWLLCLVAESRRHLTWNDLVASDIKNAGDIMDRRIKSKAASGTLLGRDGRPPDARAVKTAQMSTQAKTLQNLGNRIRRKLGKLAYHWQQDGTGVVWDAACQ